MSKPPLLLPVALLLLCAAGAQAAETGELEGYPDFITKNEDYYVTRIDGVPRIDGGEYRLKVTGLVATPKESTLDDLRALELVELPLTVECIGNPRDGHLLSTAVWKGFKLYDFLSALGLSDEATGVVYRSADGYYASHSLDQIKDNSVLAALYMNGEPIPPVHGFPLRILNPGYYGVKQPAWVTEIEVIGRPMKDYWEDRGWDCSPPMAVDCVIFSPDSKASLKAGEALTVRGAAFGGKRIHKVEVTTDGGKTFREAQIVERLDADNVWVFWRAEVSFDRKGSYTVNARATNTAGETQQEKDPDVYDGTNDWPVLRVSVTE